VGGKKYRLKDPLNTAVLAEVYTQDPRIKARILNEHFEEVPSQDEIVTTQT